MQTQAVAKRHTFNNLISGYNFTSTFISVKTLEF